MLVVTATERVMFELLSAFHLDFRNFIDLQLLEYYTERG